MADVSSTLRAWSATAANNSPSGSTTIGAGLDDNLRQIQAVVRQFLASQATTVTPSAGIADLSAADGHWVPIAGNATVTGFGTEVAGIEYILNFLGTSILVNGANLSVPGGATLVAATGDACVAESQGSGIWKLWGFSRTGVQPQATNNTFGTIVKRKTTAQTVTGNNSVAVSDTDLSFSIGANEEWVGTVFWPFGTSFGTTGSQVTMTVPSGASVRFSPFIIGGGNQNFYSGQSSTSGQLIQSVAGQVTGNNVLEKLDFWVLNGSTAGTVQAQFCQSTSTTVGLVAAVGSYLQATRVA